MITAEMAIVERHLARLVREQMKLVTKEAALTRAERRDFRTRAKKISVLLRETRRKSPNDSLLIASRIYQLLK